MAATMKTALLDERGGLRTFVIVLATDDEAVKSLTSFAVNQRLAASHFTAIGAFSRAVVAYFDWSAKQYRHISIDEQVEVLSLMGDVTIEDGKPKVHAHVVLGKAERDRARRKKSGAAERSHHFTFSVRPSP
ncbi:MAG: hypothetical protein AUI11_12610 [Acidobacteria bacterium 13_2_20CM_2_66_4]|nr:MAG: hypothetical protein AUI11_12610 [Acidobacteria bacterium 13_2_20CM_2_66_4]